MKTILIRSHHLVLYPMCIAMAVLMLVVAPLGECADRVVTYQEGSETSDKAEPGGLAEKVGNKVPVSLQEKAEEESEAKDTPDNDAPAPADRTAPGKITVSYLMPKESGLKPIAKLLKESKGFDVIIKAVNESFKIPDMTVVFDTCEEPNAFYSPDDKQITMCYELFDYLNKRFSEDEELSEAEVGVKVVNATIFTFFHEMGHAFVDVFDLPITGREEDAVDDLATIVLLEAEADDETGDMVTDALQSFWIDAEESIDDANFWGEHSMNLQRGARMLCMAYGSSPEKFADWVGGEEGLPEDRAQSCPAEYELMQRAWETLLEPYTL